MWNGEKSLAKTEGKKNATVSNPANNTDQPETFCAAGETKVSRDILAAVDEKKKNDALFQFFCSSSRWQSVERRLSVLTWSTSGFRACVHTRNITKNMCRRLNALC